MSSSDFISSQFPGPLPQWRDPRFYPNGYHREQLEIDVEQLRRHPLLRWEGEGYEGKDTQNEPWRQLAGVPLHVETLHRFSDRRQVPFKGKPLPDGSNIGIVNTAEDGRHEINGSRALRSTYELYRRWLEFLYLDSLLTLNITRPAGNNGEVQVTVVNDDLIKKVLRVDMFRDAANITAEEQDRVPKASELSPFEPEEGLEWLAAWRKNVINTIQDMLAATTWAKSVNRADQGVMQEAYENLSSISKVLVSILYKEELFERRLRVLHVEDEHIFKRVRLVGTEYNAIVGRNNWERLYKRYYGRVVLMASSFQRDLRNLFSYRQLRDWGFGRPWHKMHLVFDTDAQPDLKDPVQRVRQLLSSSRRAEDLFGVLPVDLSDISEEAKCTVCLEDWKDQDLTMETHCHHYFHVACLVRYWDLENRFQFLCPLCRTSGGRVRDRVNFRVEREDFVPDSSQAAAHELIIQEIRRLRVQFGHIRPEQLPQDYRLAIGREREMEMLRKAARDQEEGGPLPLP